MIAMYHTEWYKSDAKSSPEHTGQQMMPRHLNIMMSVHGHICSRDDDEGE